MRISEIYSSIQGEGPGIGWPTQFIRFAGCNLRCPGWPCDTQHAIDPRLYRNEWQLICVNSIIDRLEKHIRRVTLTGGEPFLQTQIELSELVDELSARDFEIEIFTNGTFPLPTWVLSPNVHIIMDWKLVGSGEDPYNAQRIKNLPMLNNEDAVKFVCRDEADFLQACATWAAYLSVPSYDNDPIIYAGAVWGQLKESVLATWIQHGAVPFRLNVQMHNYIFPAHERRR